MYISIRNYNLRRMHWATAVSVPFIKVLTRFLSSSETTRDCILLRLVFTVSEKRLLGSSFSVLCSLYLHSRVWQLESVLFFNWCRNLIELRLKTWSVFFLIETFFSYVFFKILIKIKVKRSYCARHALTFASVCQWVVHLNYSFVQNPRDVLIKQMKKVNSKVCVCKLQRQIPWHYTETILRFRHF